MTLIQASEDAKKIVEEERAFARAEIESARAAIQRVEQAFQEQQHFSRDTEMQVHGISYKCNTVFFCSDFSCSID